MNIRLLCLILASVSLSALAQLALKHGVSQARGAGGATEAIGFLLQPFVIFGLALYGLGAVLWLSVLARAELSLAYPFVGLGFILTATAGALVLGESLSLSRLAGTIMIAVGCVIVARS